MSASIDAMDLGKTFVKMDPYEIAKAMEKMTPNDKAFFKMGVKKKLVDMIDTKDFEGGTVDVTRQLLSHAMRGKILQAFDGNKSEYSAFMREVLKQSRFHKTQNIMYGNSQTDIRKLGREQFAKNGKNVREIAEDVIEGRYMAGIKKIAANLRDDPRMSDEKLMDALNVLVFQHAPPQLRRQLEGMDERARQLIFREALKTTTRGQATGVTATQSPAIIEDQQF
jgi:hypothetical protein